MLKLAQTLGTSTKLFALICTLGVFSQLSAEVIFEDDFSDNKRNGWLIANDSERALFVSGERLTADAGKGSLTFLTYFPATTLANGESITLDFNFTMEGNTFTLDGFRYGLLNSFDSKIKRDVNPSGSGDVFEQYRGVAGFHSMSTPSQHIQERVGGHSSLMTKEAGGFSKQLKFQSENLGIAVGSTVYEGQLLIRRTDDSSFLISSNLNGVEVSVTQKNVTNFTFDTIVFHAGNGNVDFSVDDIRVSKGD